jgi:hypothetical protein
MEKDQKKGVCVWRGVSKVENGYVASLDQWSLRYDTEVEAVIAHDLKVLEQGSNIKTNLDAGRIRFALHRGGDTFEGAWERLREATGAKSLEGLRDNYRRCKIRLMPLPALAPQQRQDRGRPMAKTTYRRSSEYVGVYLSGNTWQAKVGRKYVGTSADERVAALMRDVAVYAQTMADLAFPIEFIEEVLGYGGVEALRQPVKLSLFINRLDTALATAKEQRRQEAAREVVDAGPGKPVVKPEAGPGSTTDG